MKYRAEIDGLRAVAVIPVLFYHAGFSWFSGGYVGVDVFFVISGYLITSILIGELESGKFNIWRFYERRARRILPALCFVMLACIPFGWAWMLPDQFKDFGQSIIAVVFFASNILFWHESGYFEASAEEKPLLHTWSLAVEEQYYLLFPLFLFFAFRYGKQRMFWAICVVGFISFCFSEWAARNWPVANFYLLPSRIWELLTGSLVAFIISNRGVRANGFYALCGLLAILYAIFTFDNSTSFPSTFALLPVGGSVAIILYARMDTWIGKILSLRPMVGLGLISYSIYLWHQPLFAFIRIRLMSEPTPVVMMGLSALAIILAYITWALIERPFRRSSDGLNTGGVVFGISGASLTVFAVFGGWIHVQNGVEFRLSDDVKGVMAMRGGDSTQCHNGLSREQVIQGETCKIGNMAQTATIAILGDSHAARVTDAFADTLNARGQAAVIYNASWCVPLMHFATDAVKKRNCVQNVNAWINHILHKDEIETIILFAEWSNYTVGSRFGAKVADSYVFDKFGTFSFADAKTAANAYHFERAVSYTFERLKNAGKQVVVIMPTPEFNFHVPKTLAKLKLFNQSQTILPVVDKAGYDARNHEAISILRQYADKFRFDIVDPFPIFCKTQICVFSDPKGQALFEDDNHLNYNGAQLLMGPIFHQIDHQ